MNTIYEAIIIGAGPSGLMALKEFQRKKIDCIALEKTSEIGGLWRWLPDWQDIQSRKEDWSLKGIKIEGEDRINIQKCHQQMVEKWNLKTFIRFSEEVIKVHFNNNKWTIITQKNEYQCKHFVVATGAHNIACFPDIEKREPDILEYHSSELKDTTILKNKTVAVIGSGASAMDVIDLCFKNKSKKIHWLYRSNKWFIPTTKKKHTKTTIRQLAFGQMLGQTSEEINAAFQKILNSKYEYFGLNDILPTENFDIQKQQILPGRPKLVSRFKEISRHKIKEFSIEKNVIEADKENIQADIIIYCTGFKTDLSFLDLPEYKDVRSAKELNQKLGSMCLSLDYPNLYFIGAPVLDTNSTIPFMASVLAKSVASVIKGKTQLPLIKPRDKDVTLQHWDVLKYLAKYDKNNYPYFIWKPYFLYKSWRYNRHQHKLINI